MAAPRCTPIIAGVYRSFIFQRERVAMEERFRGRTNIGGGSQVILNPQPLDDVEYINDDGGVMVAE